MVKGRTIRSAAHKRLIRDGAPPDEDDGGDEQPAPLAQRESGHLKTIIKNTRPTILSTCSAYTLLPGRTDVDEADYAKFRDDPTFLSWRKLGWVQVKGAPLRKQSDEAEAPDMEGDEPLGDDTDVEVDEETLESLLALNVTNAKTTIEATDDEDLLLSWHERDKRGGVKKAIEARLSALERPEPATKGVKGEHIQGPTFGAEGVPDDEE